MAKTKPAPAAEPALPDIGAEPGVAAARAKRDELRADLDRVRAELAAIGDAAAGPAPDPVEVEARRRVGDPSAAADGDRIVKAARAVELRQEERILARAVAMASEACDRVERQTAAALTPTAVATAFAPKVRAAGLAYLAAVAAVDAVREEVGRLAAAGFTAGLVSPFGWDTFPLTADPGNGLPEMVKSLVAAGAVTREEVAESLPVLASRGHI